MIRSQLAVRDPMKRVAIVVVVLGCVGLGIWLLTGRIGTPATSKVTQVRVSMSGLQSPESALYRGGCH